MSWRPTAAFRFATATVLQHQTSLFAPHVFGGAPIREADFLVRTRVMILKREIPYLSWSPVLVCRAYRPHPELLNGADQQLPDTLPNIKNTRCQRFNARLAGKSGVLFPTATELGVLKP
jgi:hypothetical protein